MGTNNSSLMISIINNFNEFNNMFTGMNDLFPEEYKNEFDINMNTINSNPSVNPKEAKRFRHEKWLSKRIVEFIISDNKTSGDENGEENNNKENNNKENNNKNNEDNKSCTICLTDFNNDDVQQIVRFPCRHYFHYSCALTWLQQSETCPLCRRKYSSVI